MQIKHSRKVMFVVGIAVAFMLAGRGAAVAADARDDASPWAMGMSAEWSGDYPTFNPLLQKAGVKWIRLFTEWQTIQPRQGQWNWDIPDKMVANARANNLRIVPAWCYFAPWASADGGTRKGPIKDMQYWRDYVSATVTRYQKDIKYWEVWNEFNGSFYVGPNKPKEYADLVVAAYDAAKKIDPDAKIGMSVANFDVGFFDSAIKAGAADHFDFICVHPYENLGAAMDGGEPGFLSMAGSLRKMLTDNKQRADMPLWITEIGYQAPVKPDPKGDALQAEALVKAYILPVAQGFQRIFWFEARGPAYGSGTDHGIIRSDWTLRPSYDALKTMTGLMGEEPKYLGWLKLGADGYGFVFQGKGTKVLAAWSPPGATNKIKFNAPVRMVDLAGKETALKANQELALTKTPVFIANLPEEQAALAQSQVNKPFPWGTDYAKVQEVSCRLGAVNMEKGIKQTNPRTTVVVNEPTESWRRTDITNAALNHEGAYAYFRVDPTFASFGTKNLAITVVARRTAPDKGAGFLLCYESLTGYKGAPGGWWGIPADDQWHEYTWTVDDANFVGGWGWNFRTDAISSGNDFWIKEVRVKKVAP